MKSLYPRLLAAVIISLLFSIVPLPDFLSGIRPPIVLLFILYVQFYLPAFFSLTAILLIGLCMDVLLATILGQHAMALVLASWLLNSRARRFQFFSIGQQMLLVGLVCFIYQFSLLLVDIVSAANYHWFSALACALLGMFFWPWLKILADDSFFLKSPVSHPR